MVWVCITNTIFSCMYRLTHDIYATTTFIFVTNLKTNINSTWNNIIVILTSQKLGDVCIAVQMHCIICMYIPPPPPPGIYITLLYCE